MGVNHNFILKFLDFLLGCRMEMEASVRKIYILDFAQIAQQEKY
jgi:hypothetical protein